MSHVVLRLPLGKGAGQQLQAVFSSLEALEDTTAYHADDAVALASGSRVEEALQEQAVNQDIPRLGACSKKNLNSEEKKQKKEKNQ